MPILINLPFQPAREKKSCYTLKLGPFFFFTFSIAARAVKEIQYSLLLRLSLQSQEQSVKTLLVLAQHAKTTSLKRRGERKTRSVQEPSCLLRCQMPVKQFLTLIS